MSDDIGSREVAVTSHDFRKLAESAGKVLNDSTQQSMRSAGKTPGFLPISIEEHEKVLKDVMDYFEAEEFERLHPGGKIRWHKLPHIITQSVLIPESTFADAEDDLMLLPLFVGQAEGQDKKIGQPSSLKKSFRIFEGDILLVYKSEIRQ